MAAAVTVGGLIAAIVMSGALKAPGAAGATGAIATWLYLQSTKPPVDEPPKGNKPGGGRIKSSMRPLSDSIPVS